jgi:light-harvesting protein B-800-850 alpha chain
MSFMDYKPAEQDYKFWLVVNPSTWLIPTFIALLLLVISIHSYALSLPGRAWTVKSHAAPVAVAPAPVAAPAAK